MSALAASHDALLPRQDNRLGLGAALALLAHGGLVAALALGLNWHLPTGDTVVSAELWSAVPQVAAPAPVAPAPAPPPAPPAPSPAPAPPPQPTAAERQALRDADIATEKAKADQKRQQEAAEAARLKQRLDAKRVADEREAKRLKDAQKAEQAKADQARETKRLKDLAAQKDREKAALADAKAKADAKTKADAAADAKAQAEQIARQREENLKRMLGQAGATGAATATGTAKADAAPSAGYAGRIKGAILPNIVQPEKERGNPVTEVEVLCGPDGSILNFNVTKPSGNPAWDETVKRAIDKTRRLPLDNGRIPPKITLVFSQNEAR